MARKFCIGGNWKMQITRTSDAIKVAQELASKVDSNEVEVFIAPSYHALQGVGQALTASVVQLAAQNMHSHDSGAFTGEISVESLLDVGCKYVILGHSERRKIFGETDDLINKKVLKALEKGLKVCLCIGETAKERAQGKTAEINQSQLTGSLKGVTAKQLQQVVIAYEPVWAINNKFLNPDTEIRAASPAEAADAHRTVRQWFRTNYGNESANEMRILYGGSMNDKNAKELLSLEDIDGGLIGGASLKAETFLPIITQAEKLTKARNQPQWEGNTLKF